MLAMDDRIGKAQGTGHSFSPRGVTSGHVPYCQFGLHFKIGLRGLYATCVEPEISQRCRGGLSRWCSPEFYFIVPATKFSSSASSELTSSPLRCRLDSLEMNVPSERDPLLDQPTNTKVSRALGPLEISRNQRYLRFFLGANQSLLTTDAATVSLLEYGLRTFSTYVGIQKS